MTEINGEQVGQSDIQAEINALGTEPAAQDPFADLGLNIDMITPPDQLQADMVDIRTLLFEFNEAAASIIFKTNELKKGMTSLTNLVKLSGKDVFYKSIWLSNEPARQCAQLYATDGMAYGRRYIPFHEIHNDTGLLGIDFKQLASVINYLGYATAIEKTQTGIRLIYDGGDTTLFAVTKNDNMFSFAGFSPLETFPSGELIEAFKFARNLVAKTIVPDLSKIFISDNKVWSFDVKGYTAYALTTPSQLERGFMVRDIDAIVRFFDSLDPQATVNLLTKDDYIMFSSEGYGDIVIKSFTQLPSVTLITGTPETIVSTFKAGMNSFVQNLVVALRTREVGIIDLYLVAEDGNGVINVNIRDLKGGQFRSRLRLNDLLTTELYTDNHKITIALDRFVKLIGMLMSQKTEVIVQFELHSTFIKVEFENKVVSIATN